MGQDYITIPKTLQYFLSKEEQLMNLEGNSPLIPLMPEAELSSSEFLHGILRHYGAQSHMYHALQILHSSTLCQDSQLN